MVGWFHSKTKQARASSKPSKHLHRGPSSKDWIWTDKGREFYNKNLWDVLEEKGVNIYSTENEKKYSVVKRLNRTVKQRMWKYFTASNSTQYFGALPGLANQYNSTKHSSVKMTPIEARKRSNEGLVYFNLFDESKREFREPKFKVGDKVRISKYKRKVFDKPYKNWREEVFVVDKIQFTNPIT